MRLLPTTSELVSWTGAYAVTEELSGVERSPTRPVPATPVTKIRPPPPEDRVEPVTVIGPPASCRILPDDVASVLPLIVMAAGVADVKPNAPGSAPVKVEGGDVVARNWLLSTSAT